jgi:hypothetical protein
MELPDPMQPPLFAIRKIREAERAANPKPAKPVVAKPKIEPLRLNSIIFIDDQMLAIGDRIR